MDSSIGTTLVVIVVAVAVAALVAAALLVFKLVRRYQLVRSVLPWQGKAAFWIAVLYTVSPVDLLPDPVYLDDVGVLLGAFVLLGRLARRQQIFRAPGTAGPEVGERNPGP